MNEELIKERIDSLVKLGEMVLASRYGTPTIEKVNDQLFVQWQAGSLAFLKKVFDKHIYYEFFANKCVSNYANQVQEGLGVLKAAESDINAGFYESAIKMAAAEVFTDFLDMVDHLLENGYKDPAAMLSGAVLEDGLRRICEGKITVKEDDNITSLNNRLADKGIYTKIMRKSIDTWGAIRNSADHGRFEEYTLSQVEEMRTGIRGLLAQQL